MKENFQPEFKSSLGFRPRLKHWFCMERPSYDRKSRILLAATTAETKKGCRDAFLERHGGDWKAWEEWGLKIVKIEPRKIA